MNPLPPEALLAYVTVIPKPGKDSQYCTNYRLISLLNTDTKLLAKILATRLQDKVTQVINLDQTGFFMMGQETKDDTIQAIKFTQLDAEGTQ